MVTNPHEIRIRAIRPPRAPALHDQCAGDFEQKISRKENARAQAEDPIRESKIVRHFKARKPDVYTIQVSDKIEDEKKWQQTPRNASPGAFCNIR